MNCQRCKTRMIESTRLEHEFIGDVDFKQVHSMRECPTCDIIIMTIVPFWNGDDPDHYILGDTHA